MDGTSQTVRDPLAVAVVYLLGSLALVMVAAEALQVQQGNQNHNPDNSILGPAEIQSHSESLLMQIRILLLCQKPGILGIFYHLPYMHLRLRASQHWLNLVDKLPL